MNYRHSFHAGNFADVFKHAALTLLLLSFRQKDKPFVVIDTHAGIGLYDLRGDEALRTNEAAGGVLRLKAKDFDHPSLALYKAALERVNPLGEPFSFYPGSPEIARGLLRSEDRLVAIEMHPEDGKKLASAFRHDRRVRTIEGDGYKTLKSLLPPPERRGLVLIDPPFEVEDEYRRISRALAEAVKRWPTGCYVVWHPIKNPTDSERFIQENSLLGRLALAAEFMMSEPDDAKRLNGAGLFIVNPPWKIDSQIMELMNHLSLCLQASGRSTVRWVGVTE